MRAHFPQDLRRLPRVFVRADEPTRLCTGEEKHLKARRRDHVLGMDGLGHAWLTQVSDNARLKIQHEVPIPPAPDRHLIAALPAREGLFEMVRLATMGGVTRLIFFVSEHSKSHGRKLTQNDRDRALRIVRATAKQALVFDLPTLCWPAVGDDLAAMLDRHTNLCLFDPGGASAVSLAGRIPVIGPEGGWSEPELALVQARQVVQVALDMPVLTAPAAALAALAMMQDSA